MRESKFRGKRIDNDKWVYGDLIHCYGADAGRIFIKTFTGLYEVDPTTVGEYIGLKDNNGTDVWEGDIVEWENLMKINRRSVIAYRDVSRWNRDANNEPEEIWCCSFTKIGNIHDTPELLKTE